LSSSWPSSEDEPKRWSESGDNQIGGTGTCLCLNQTSEGDLFLPQQTLFWGAILAKDDCGCVHDMTWKNQQMEMKTRVHQRWQREMIKRDVES
jgi:hypothetical protein